MIMPIWEVNAKRKFNNGPVVFEPSMSVKVQTNTTSSSFWTLSQYKKAIAEEFVSQYGLKCPVSKFEQQVNNVKFSYTLISK